MQHEKLNNSHKTALLIIARFVHKIKERLLGVINFSMLLENMTPTDPFFPFFILLLFIQIVEFLKLPLSSCLVLFLKSDYMELVELFTLHLAVYSGFFILLTKAWKSSMDNNTNHLSSFIRNTFQARVDIR